MHPRLFKLRRITTVCRFVADREWQCLYGYALNKTFGNLPSNKDFYASIGVTPLCSIYMHEKFCHASAGKLLSGLKRSSPVFDNLSGAILNIEKAVNIYYASILY